MGRIHPPYVTASSLVGGGFPGPLVAQTSSLKSPLILLLLLLLLLDYPVAPLTPVSTLSRPYLSGGKGEGRVQNDGDLPSGTLSSNDVTLR